MNAKHLLRNSKLTTCKLHEEGLCCTYSLNLLVHKRKNFRNWIFCSVIYGHWSFPYVDFVITRVHKNIFNLIVMVHNLLSNKYKFRSSLFRSGYFGDKFYQAYRREPTTFRGCRRALIALTQLKRTKSVERRNEQETQRGEQF